MRLSIPVSYTHLELGPVNFDGERTIYEQSDLSQEMAAKIDVEVKKISDVAYKQAITILTRLRGKLDIIAEELMKKETIDSDEMCIRDSL